MTIIFPHVSSQPVRPIFIFSELFFWLYCLHLFSPLIQFVLASFLLLRLFVNSNKRIWLIRLELSRNCGCLPFFGSVGIVLRNCKSLRNDTVRFWCHLLVRDLANLLVLLLLYWSYFCCEKLQLAVGYLRSRCKLNYKHWWMYLKITRFHHLIIIRHLLKFLISIKLINFLYFNENWRYCNKLNFVKIIKSEGINLWKFRRMLQKND